MKYGLGSCSNHQCGLDFLLFYFKLFLFLNVPLALAPFLQISYQILCPKQLKEVSDPKKAAGVILESTGLPDDAFRLGNTKARVLYINLFFNSIRVAATI